MAGLDRAAAHRFIKSPAPKVSGTSPWPVRGGLRARARRQRETGRRGRRGVLLDQSDASRYGYLALTV